MSLNSNSIINLNTESTTHLESTTNPWLGNSSDVNDQSFHCGHGSLLGPLGLLVQFLLAFIAFSALIVKRFCEPKYERRPWKIWFFDTSKQAVGAAVIHFANVFLAELFHGDPCTWYIISFLLDSTLGLLVIYLGLQISQLIARWKKWDSLLLGDYGTPPHVSWWIGQCGLYVLVMLVEKFLMTFLVLFDFWKKVRAFIMSPIKNPQLELVIVMFIVPFVVNAFIFWVVDNFLKKKAWKAPRPINSNEAASRYFRSQESVRFYGGNRPQTNNSEADDAALLLVDDELLDPGTPTENGGVVHRHRTDSSGSEHHPVELSVA